ncbi:MAG: hypothetical protein KBS96_07865 [Lachnospiraceae bacterium]|nr:hypothetical protein [Candidatus Colinaster scatohippi]
MGSGNWTASNWSRFSSSRIAGKSTSAIYSGVTAKKEFLPMNVVRESCDSDDHPNSTPIILGLDVTGSMSGILNVMADKIGMVMGEIYKRNPVEDPQILFSAIGDAMCDRYPLQVTQFESDIRIAEQLTQVYFERGGGGNGFESYPLAWYFAANHTKTDQYEKRGKKGYIFTFGDDGYPEVLTASEINRIFGDRVYGDIPTKQVLKQAQKKYEIYHFCMGQGGSYRESDFDKWQNLLGERALRITDYTKIPEVIVSLLEMNNGKTKEEVLKTWDRSTAMVLRDTLPGEVKRNTFLGKLVNF